MDIILYLLQLIQYQHKQLCWLINFICRYIPLKQWAFDDSHSPNPNSFPINRNGTGRISSLTISGVTINPLSLCSDAWNVIFPNPVTVLFAVRRLTISRGTMGNENPKCCARSARHIFLQPKITVFPKLPC